MLVTPAFAAHAKVTKPHPLKCIDAERRLHYLRPWDTSPQREADYLEG